MKEIKYIIKDELGMHARPAGLLVKQAASFESDIKIIKDEKEVDAKRIIGLMTLGVMQGDTITVQINGPDEDDAIKAIEEFLENNL